MKSQTKTREWLDEGPGRQSLTRQQREEAIRVVRDVYKGPLHLRSLNHTYLPQFPQEDDQLYERRRKSAALFNATKKTVGALVGMMMQKDVEVSDRVPDVVKRHLSDVDQGGRNISAFATDLSKEAWQDALGLIFVDMPDIKPGTTKAQAAGARPYWQEVTGNQVLDAKVKRVGSVEVLQSIRWREWETVTDPDDRYKEQLDPRVREMERVQDEEGRPRVQWRVYRIQDGEGQAGKPRWVIATDDDGNERQGLMGPQMDVIPVTAAYTNRAGPFDGDPPLTDLAIENVRHFQKSSDKDNVEHVTAVPILTITGESKDKVAKVAIGTGVGVVLANPDSNMFYTEPDGAGAEINRKALDESERHMALMGGSLLYSDSRAPETATSKRIDKAESDASLTSYAGSLENALDSAVHLHAKWLGVEIPEGEELLVQINRDFEKIQVDAQKITAMAALVPHIIPREDFYAWMKRAGELPENFDPKLALQRIEDQEGEQLAAIRALIRGKGEADDENDEGVAV